ncbi:hypothetical protein HanHA300_Chr03g0091361 [Helianthus annuus]|nr:hypothetical protein HanHA300_Chr03g0091361 [Helianthus annuus]KAJ0607936.1 hypothetical protein HanHA89_Chr03g0103011 [Helianthus annuus]KAJ0767999.1 hypothetical protein HanLR1_Chr03g0096381 [Helianthus annuus]
MCLVTVRMVVDSLSFTLCSRVSFNRKMGGKMGMGGKRDENIKNHVPEFHLIVGGEGKREENMTIYLSSQIKEIRRENFPSHPPLK